MMRTSQITIIIILNLMFNSISAKSQDNYAVSPELDIPVFMLGAALFTYSNSINNNKNLDSAEVRSIIDNYFANPSNEPVTCQSKTASFISDVLVASITSAPLILSISQYGFEQQFGAHLIMSLEANLLNYSLNSIVKVLTGSPRPYVFIPVIPFLQKLNPDAFGSFYSGHTSASFANAVIFASMFERLSISPGHTGLVWSSSIGAAGLVGLFRILSGNHYLEDVLVGAAAGSLIGYFVTNIHEGEERGIDVPLDNKAIFQISFSREIKF